MSEIPEDAKTVTSEGRDLASALETAAKELGTAQRQLGYKLDMSHFRGEGGKSVPRETVRVIAWPLAEDGGGEPVPDEAPQEAAPAKKAPKAAPDAETKEPRLRGAEAGETEASRFAQRWFERLLELMDITGSVKATGNDERVHIEVKADKAGRIIGRRGTTLGAIRHLLKLTLLKEHGDLVIDVDIADERGESAEPRREAAKEGGRGRGRGRREERSGNGRLPQDKIVQLARRAAQKALDSGKTITINLDLNSFDRRVVHVEVAEIEGVTTRSEERDGKKYVQVIPE